MSRPGVIACSKPSRPFPGRRGMPDETSTPSTVGTASPVLGLRSKLGRRLAAVLVAVLVVAVVLSNATAVGVLELEWP